MDTSMRLKNIPLFASLAPDNLARVAELATRRSYPRGSLLCRQDEFGQTLYVIDSGEAVRRQTDLRGIERPVGYLREGDFIGDDALLLGDAYGSCVQATTDIEVLCIRKQDFDRLLEEHPEIRNQLTLRRLVKERLLAPEFPWLGEDERSLLLRRRHWLAFVRTLSIPLLTSLALGMAAWLLSRLGITMSMPFLFLFIGGLPGAMVLWYCVDWRNDFYLVTSKRILHEEKVVFLYETWDEIPLNKIENTFITHSALGNLLGFGVLHIETASARGVMALDYLPDPESMEEVIFKGIGHLRSRMQQEEREEIRRELLREIIERGKAEGEQSATPPPPQEQPKEKLGFLARLLPSRPLLGLRHEQADQVTWRKHWIFLIKRIYLALPAAVLITTAVITITLSRWPARYRIPLFLASLVLWTVAVFWLWWEVEDWRNDEYIVTDRLIIDVEKKPLFFGRERREAPLDKILSVSERKQGLLATIFNYGDVLIQTAAATGDFTFDGVGNPAQVRREVYNRVEAYRANQQRREREQRKAELSTWFQLYHEMNQEKESPDAA